jgi:hypothetical protein
MAQGPEMSLFFRSGPNNRTKIGVINQLAVDPIPALEPERAKLPSAGFMRRISHIQLLRYFLFLIAMAFCAASSQAAINMDSRADCATATSGSSGSNCSPSSGGTSATLAWSHTIGSGTSRILLVGVSLSEFNNSPNGNVYVNTITYGSSSLTCLKATEDNSGGSCGTGASGTFFVRSEVWYLLNPPVGSGTITITTNSSLKTTIAGSSVSYFGVLGVTSGGASSSQTNNSTGTSTASLAVISAANNLVLGNVSLAKNFSGTQITVTSGNTALSDIADNGTSGSHVQDAASFSTAVNPTMSWTFTTSGTATSPWAVVAAVLTPSQQHRAHVTVGSLISPRILAEDGPLATLVTTSEFQAAK